MLAIQAIDPFTGEKFTKKRHNQKFANRRNQTRFNNLKALKKRQLKKKIDQPLDRNRNILMEILGNNKEIIRSKDWLLALGYNFSLYTYSIKIGKEVVPCVYEFIIQKINDNKYKISKDKSY